MSVIQFPKPEDTCLSDLLAHAGEKLNKEVDLFGTTEINELEQTQQQHQETAQRVDAYRSLM